MVELRHRNERREINLVNSNLKVRQIICAVRGLKKVGGEGVRKKLRKSTYYIISYIRLPQYPVPQKVC